MSNWLHKMFGQSRKREHPEPIRRNPPAKIPPIRDTTSGLRAMPGALVAESHSGQVIYNMLTPHMGQFMGRCIGDIKRAGIAAKGTGQFSILVGEQMRELRLDRFYQPTNDLTMEQVVTEARRITHDA